MRNPVKRGAVAVATALCLFLVLASPASANPYPLTVVGGSLTAAGNTFNLAAGGGGGGGTPPCSSKASTLQVAIAGNANSGTFTISGGWSSQFQLGTPPSGQWYQADFSVAGGGNGTYSLNAAGPPNWTYNVSTTGATHVIFQVRIYRVPNCDKSDLACIITVRMSFTGTLTSTAALPTYTPPAAPTPPTPDPGGINLNGASIAPHIAVASCSAPFVSWAGQTASATGLALR
jgi:hypothetical protein